MKILITGGSGRIGLKLIKTFLPKGYEVASISKLDKVPLNNVKNFLLDLTDKNKVLDVIKTESPDIVIHTAALTNVDLCESDKKLAYNQNVMSTRNVIEACKQVGSKLIFVSSAFVFNGKGKVFTEESEMNPINYYGETKMISEKDIKDSGLKYLILRTDQPYGEIEEWQKDDNVRRVLKKLNQGLESREPTDWYNNPTYIDDFSIATLKLIETNKEGIYNLVGPDFINRYEWALKIAEVFDKDKNLIVPIKSNALNISAKRPYANLSNKKTQTEINFKFRNIIEGTRDLVNLYY
jgi:dTDP-4-dehydrorhamnose reductase